MKKEPEISSLIDKAVFDYKLIEENDRICQFRIQEKMPDVTFTEVDTLGNDSRGGFGSTGKE